MAKLWTLNKTWLATDPLIVVTEIRPGVMIEKSMELMSGTRYFDMNVMMPPTAGEDENEAKIQKDLAVSRKFLSRS